MVLQVHLFVIVTYLFLLPNMISIYTGRRSSNVRAHNKSTDQRHDEADASDDDRGETTEDLNDTA